MNLAPILSAPLAIKIHLVTVLPAFAIGTWQIFFSTKGAPLHRILGSLYLILMVATALATLFIRTIHPGHFSGIHVFIPLTLLGVAGSVLSLRRGDIAGHKRAMLLLYFGALVIAGGFTLVPGRLLHGVLFG